MTKKTLARAAKDVFEVFGNHFIFVFIGTIVGSGFTHLFYFGNVKRIDNDLFYTLLALALVIALISTIAHVITEYGLSSLDKKTT